MTTCTGPGINGQPCGRPINGHGLCYTHREQQRKGVELRPIRAKASRVPERCTVDGCDALPWSRGMCQKHYRRAARRLARDGEKQCSGPDCDRLATDGGLCGAHRQQAKRRGPDNLKPLNTPAERKPYKPRTPKPKQLCPGPGVDGGTCGRVATNRGLCGAHAKQRSKGQELRPIGTRRKYDPDDRCPAPGPGGTCGRPIKARGLCHAHANQQRKGRELTDLTAVVRGYGPAGGPCRGPGRDGQPCPNPSKARGLCGLHWRQDQRGEELRPPKIASPGHRKSRTRTDSNLPAGWFKPTLTAKKPSAPAQEGDVFGFLPPCPPPTVDQQRAALRLLERHDCGDLAEILGLAS